MLNVLQMKIKPGNSIPKWISCWHLSHIKIHFLNMSFEDEYHFCRLKSWIYLLLMNIPLEDLIFEYVSSAWGRNLSICLLMTNMTPQDSFPESIFYWWMMNITRRLKPWIGLLLMNIYLKSQFFESDAISKAIFDRLNNNQTWRNFVQNVSPSHSAH